ADLLFEPGLSAVVPPAGMLEVPPVAGDRISPAPQGDLRFIPIPRRVVTRGMRAEPVRHCLDHRGAVALSGAFGRVPGGPEDRERVHPVDSDAIEPVRRGFLRERRGRRLLRDGYRNGP